MSVKDIEAPDDAATIVTRHLLKDGRAIDVQLTSHRLDFAGRRAVLTSVQDVTDRNALEQQLRHQALHDSLTGLANRVLLADRAEHALSLRREGRDVGVLVLDLDGFKDINDGLGHAAGDELLVLVSQRLTRVLRQADTAARLGGDEFVVLVEDVTAADDLVSVANRIAEVLRTPFLVAGHSVVISASVGIALSCGGEHSYDLLLRDADTAMYAAKVHNRGGAVVFQPAMHAAAMERLELEAALRRGLASGELEVHYQPIIELSSHRIVGLEALARWWHPRRGLVAPADFIPLAEKTGLIFEVGAEVLLAACEQASRWHPDLTVNVNLSARQLADGGIVGLVGDVLQATSLAPERLTLEITESEIMADTAMSIERLTQLKELGVRVAIDDFGTGYSSLAYLRRLPIDVIKIDKTFIDPIATDVEAGALVKAILHLAKTLGLRAVAEGIESAAQLAELRRFGGEYAQGYLLSPPVPARDLTGVEPLHVEIPFIAAG